MTLLLFFSLNNGLAGLAASCWLHHLFQFISESEVTCEVVREAFSLTVSFVHNGIPWGIKDV